MIEFIVAGVGGAAATAQVAKDGLHAGCGQGAFGEISLAAGLRGG